MSPRTTRRTTEVHLPHQTVVELPDGATISDGDQFTVHGERARYKFRYQWTPDGSLAAWGPVNKDGTTLQEAQWRAFTAEQIRKVWPSKGRLQS